MDPNACEVCGQKFIVMFSVHDTYLCKPCYNKQMCRYCDPPVSEKDCPGHSISRNTENRFMADKEFVAGSQFEVG